MFAALLLLLSTYGCNGYIDYNYYIQNGIKFPSYIPTSPDLWAKPHLSMDEKKNHPFFGEFQYSSLLDNCTEKFMTQVIDHFNWRPAVNGQTT